MFGGLGVAELAFTLGGGIVAAGGVGGYLMRSRIRERLSDGPDDFVAFRDRASGAGPIALVVPESPGVDAIAAALGLSAVCREWGVAARPMTAGPVTSDDARAFCNLFDVNLPAVEDERLDADVAVAVGGTPPSAVESATRTVAVVSHRPVADDRLVVGGGDGATSTTVARLLEWTGVTPDRRTATALLYGVRAGTGEFRRVRGESDYAAARFLHGYADRGRLDALRAPGLSDETFDVVGTAIDNRERRATFAVTNVGSVPAMSALEEATDVLLRLDGVSTAAAFGVYEGTVVISCRAEDVRTSALDLLEEAFTTASVAGDADAATARVDLGLFGRVREENRDTLDELVDMSARRVLYGAFEGS